MSPIVIVLTTVPLGDVGETIARALVDERLAACVNLSAPMTSIYRWQGRVEREEERQLIIKTSAERVDALSARLLALHPYALPELLVCAVRGGHPGYMEWVRAETAGLPASGTAPD